MFTIGAHMATTLDVVNSCLATMGETALNSLSEPHENRSDAIKALTEANKRIQAPGWWFNTEVMSLTPAPGTGHMTLPGDCLKWQSGTRTPDYTPGGERKPWLVQRGTRLYDTRTRSFTITEDVKGEIVRLVPFEDLPQVINDYVAAEAVLKFQSNFDADNSRRQELTQAWLMAKATANAENIRQLGINFIHTNRRLQRIKRMVQPLR